MSNAEGLRKFRKDELTGPLGRARMQSPNLSDLSPEYTDCGAFWLRATVHGP